MRPRSRAVGASQRLGVARVLVVFVVGFSALYLLGFSPDPVLFGAGAVLVLCIAAAADAETGPPPGSWTADDLTKAAERLGSDHVTTALARDLAQRGDDSVVATELAARVHQRVSAILEARVWRTQGVDLRSNEAWARQVLPADLADIYLGPPDPGLLRPDRLGELVARIEAW